MEFFLMLMDRPHCLLDVYSDKYILSLLELTTFKMDLLKCTAPKKQLITIIKCITEHQ